MILARAPCPGGEVVLEIRIGAAGVLHALQRGVRKRGPPEVRVHDHPGRVQHPPQRRPPRSLQLVPDACCEITRIGAGAQLVARLGDHGPGGVDRERIIRGARELVHRREVSQLHGMQITPRIRRPAEPVASLL